MSNIKGIGYDIKEKQGTIFSLVDSLNHTNLGMIAVKDNLQISMQDFSRNLTSLHKEISSANMQGETNFIVSNVFRLKKFNINYNISKMII